MEREASPKTEAKELISYIRRMLSRKDGLIYSFDNLERDDLDPDDPLELRMLKCFTSGGLTLDVDIYITLYNVTTAEDVFSLQDALRLGGKGVDVTTHSGDRHNGYNPVIEIHKRFSY